MIIHLWEQEKMLLKKHAEEYKKKTGDSYSIYHILSILREYYEENLDKDLKKVMEIKKREFEEAEAGKEVDDKEK